MNQFFCHSIMKNLFLSFVCFFFSGLPTLAFSQVSTVPEKHYMDPLSASEYSKVINILKKYEYVGETGLYPLITLSEPDKTKTLGWKPGDTLSRQAFVIVRKNSETYQGLVDITLGKVVSWEKVKGVETGILMSEEWRMAQHIVRKDKKWQEAIQKRGITNFQEVVCIPNTAGYFGLREEEGRRLVKVVSYQSSEGSNYWSHPIEGITAIVDFDKRKVIKLIDTGVRPIPKGMEFDEASVGKLRTPPNPILNEQPGGPSFKVNGHVVSWQKWQFHFRIDPRLGLVISSVSYEDQGKKRSILYEGSLSELFVPYMDPDVGWYYKTFMDAGEYGIGKLAVELQPGLDCPANAVFFDATFADDWGDPYTCERSSCLFERSSGNIAWRHFESVNGQNETRRSTELVLRSISAIGNYDYVFDWAFQQNGSIKIAVGTSGIELVKAVRQETVIGNPNNRDTHYGHMVAKNTVAVNHDHYFCYRLDFDVDGRENSLQIDLLKTEQQSKKSPRSSVWTVNPFIPLTEKEAKVRMNFLTPALWRVINPNVLGPLGYPVSYHLKPKSNAVSLLNQDDFAQRRAGFTDFHLWVTPYRPLELYSAGIYPNQSKGGDGLPRWTAADRPIRNTDIVLWYTLGFHHVVRAEDWPVLPLAWHEFELRPFDFFDSNPALDLPKK